MLLGVHYCLAGAKYVTKNSTFLIFEQFLGDLWVNKLLKNVEIEGGRPIWRDPRRNSAETGFNIMQNGWMATQLVTKRSDFGTLGVPGPASTPLALGPGPQRHKTLIFLRFFKGWSKQV